MVYDPTRTTLDAKITEEKIDRIKKHLIEKWRGAENVSKADIESDIKNCLKKGAITDEKLKYVGLAFSFDEGSSALESGVSAYSSYLTNEIFKKTEKKENVNKKHYFVKFENNVIKTLTETGVEDYTIEKLKEAGIPESELDKSISNFEDINLNLGSSLQSDGTLREAFIVVVKKLRQQLLESEKNSNSPKIAETAKKLSPDQYNLLLQEVKESLKAACEGTSNINLAGGFDIDKVAPLFVGKDNLLSSFENFLKSYNEIMNKIENNILDENQITDIQDDIEPYFEDVANAASSLGEDGTKIVNLCKGLKSRINHACERERENGDNNILQDQAAFDNSIDEKLDANDNDGQVVNCGHTEGEHHGGGSTVSGAIDSVVGTSGVASDLTPDILEKIKAWGVEGIRTMADWIEFKNSDEFDMIQSMQSMTFGRRDDD